MIKKPDTKTNAITAADQVRSSAVNQGKATEEALNPATDTEQVRAEEVRQNSDSLLTDPQGPATGAEQVPDNITPITHARNKRTRAKSAQTGAGGQLAQNTPQAAKQPSEARKMGANETGADLIESGVKQVRKTGRKPGTKDITPRKKRIDHNVNAQIPPDDKQIIVQYNKELFMLGKLNDPNDEEEVRDRVLAYFSISEQYQQVPTVAGLALALGIDRRTLWTWMEGKVGTIKNPAVLDTLKRVYNFIGSQYEGLLTQGKIIPVAGFFLMQNNFGYKNQTDHVVVAQQAEEPDTGEIAARAGLLDSDD